MFKSLIIIGDSLRFAIVGAKFKKAARDAGSSTTSFRTAYHSNRHLHDWLKKEAEGLTRDDRLVVIYLGHGGNGFWAVNDTVKYPYDSLVSVLGAIPASVFIVNDCCHAGSLIKAINKAKMPPTRIGVLAACPENEIVYPGLTQDALEAWNNGNLYHPDDFRRIVLRIGELTKPIEKREGVVKNKVSKVLNFLSGGIIPISPIKLKVIFSEPKDREPETIEHQPAVRWGNRFDHWFFPA